MKEPQYYQTPRLFRLMLNWLKWFSLLWCFGYFLYLHSYLDNLAIIRVDFNLSILFTLGLFTLSSFINKLYVTVNEMGVIVQPLKQIIHWNEIETINTQFPKVSIKDLNGMNVSFYIYNDEVRQSFLNNISE